MYKTLLAIALISTSLSAYSFEGPFGGSNPYTPIEKDVNRTQHALDGTVIEYQYQNGWAIHMELNNGMLKYKWVSGARKGHHNQNIPYRTRKIGRNVYLVNWYEQKTKPDFITLIFNFNTDVMYSSGLVALGTKQQFSLFYGGIIGYTNYKPK